MLVKMENAVKKYGQFGLDCSLEIRPGYITGLIGQNGSGKTTAFKAILGLIGLDGGRVEILGKSPQQLTEQDRQRIGVTFASGGFSTYLTVKTIAAIQSSLYERFDETEFLGKCRRFGLPLDKQMKDFSSGMKAKVRLLCAISHQAELLVLDEPTAGLDVVARDGMLDILREYMDTEGRSILISSHISSDLESLCDDLYMIHDGRIILHEDTDRMLGSYGLIKASDSQYEKMDKSHLLCVKRESFGFSCLTDNRQLYIEKYPDIVVDNGNIDTVISMMIKGERL